MEMEEFLTFEPRYRIDNVLGKYTSGLMGGQSLLQRSYKESLEGFVEVNYECKFKVLLQSALFVK